MPCWKEPESATRRLSASIALPPGASAGAFSVKVSKDRRKLQAAVEWPPPLARVKMLHRKWLCGARQERFESCHLRIAGLEKNLKRLRDRSSQAIESIAEIRLPFSAQARIVAQHNLGWREHPTKIAHIELEACVEDYPTAVAPQELKRCAVLADK